MTRAELIARLAGKFGHLPADEVAAAVRSVIDRLSLSLQSGGRIEIRGFGGFSLRHRQPRVARNPKTGEAVALPATVAIHFKPGRELRERANALTAEKPSLPLMPDS
jgi:integration host factor subunit beta